MNSYEKVICCTPFRISHALSFLMRHQLARKTGPYNEWEITDKGREELNKITIYDICGNPAPKVENKEHLLIALNQMLIFVNEDYAKDLQQVIGIIGQLDEVES